MTTSALLDIAHIKPSQYRKVLSDWLKSAGDQSAHIDLDAYRLFVEPRLHLVRVVSPVDWPDGVTAWCCIEGETLHYVYTSRTYRRLGIIDYMLSEHRLVDYTFRRPPYSGRIAERYGLTFKDWRTL